MLSAFLRRFFAISGRFVFGRFVFFARFRLLGSTAAATGSSGLFQHKSSQQERCDSLKLTSSYLGLGCGSAGCSTSFLAGALGTAAPALHGRFTVRRGGSCCCGCRRRWPLLCLLGGLQSCNVINEMISSISSESLKSGLNSTSFCSPGSFDLAGRPRFLGDAASAIV